MWCVKCAVLSYILTFWIFTKFFLERGETGHKSDIPTTSQCTRTAGCRYKITLADKKAILDIL